jgi:hypothetical protein
MISRYLEVKRFSFSASSLILFILSDLSDFTLPPSGPLHVEPYFEPENSRFINFGVNGGKINITNIKKTFKTDYFGAYLSSTDLGGSTKLFLSREGTLINNFFPYYGFTNGHLCSAGNESHEFGGDDHERLANCLKSIKGRFAMSYYYFDKLEKWFPKNEFKWEIQEFNKAAMATKGKSQTKGMEILIMNY